jgi:hypothetical protein
MSILANLTTNLQQLDLSSKLQETNNADDDEKDNKSINDFWGTPVLSISTTTMTTTTSKTTTIP